MKRNKGVRLSGPAWLAIMLACMGSVAHAQNQNFNQYGNTTNFRNAEAIIRVAEASQLADTVLVWGDVGIPGTYLVPRGTNLMEMISYAKGPSRLASNEIMLDWSKLRVQVRVSRRDGSGSEVLKIRYDEPLDRQFRDLRLSNFDVVAVEVKRKPAFADHVKVIAPVIAAVGTVVLVVRNLGAL